jgi:serine/threonine protein kinase
MKLDDRIELVELLGTGAAGAVFKAKQQGMDRAVAVKVLHQSALSDREHVARFFREAKVISALSHPNIVKVYAVGMADDRQPYMVMDYIEGKTLADLIAEKALSAADYMDIFIQVASALSHAHRSDVVHRDIKPRNILIQRDAEKNKCIVKLADFGIARNVVPTTVQRITKAGVIIGSPIYMSPEQCTGRPVDRRTDLYSLGCVMFEAATGAVPFNDKNAAGLIGKHVMEPAPGAEGRIIIEGLSPRIAKVISLLLNKKPEDRYPDAETLQADLEAIKSGSEPPFASETTNKRVVPPQSEPQRNMNVATTTVIVGTMVAIAIFFGVRWVTAASGVNADNQNSPAVVEITKLCMHAAPHMERHEFADGARIYEHAYQMCKENKIGGKVLADICASGGFAEWRAGNIDRANEMFAAAYDYYSKTNNKRHIVELSRYWGAVCLDKGDPQKAAQLLAVAWQAYDSDEVPTSIHSKIGTLGDLCKAYTNSGKPYSAIALYPKLIQMEANFKEFPQLCAPTHEQYAAALAMVGKNDEAAKQRQIAKQFMDEQERVDDSILAK